VIQNSTSVEEVRKRANELLKGVDQLIKAGKLDLAVQEIARAKSIDPSNGYIRAFEERVAFLREEEVRKKGVDAARGQVEDAARKRLEEERRRAEEERRRKEQEIIRRVHEAHEKKSGPAASASPEPIPSVAPAIDQRSSTVTKGLEERRRIEEDAKRKFQEEFRLAEASKRSTITEDSPRPVRPVASATEANSMYKRVLLLAWADGALTAEERNQLKDLRASLTISPEEHERLEQEAKEESYAHAFELIWVAGLSVHERSSVIAELRTKFKLVPDAYSRLEARLLARLDPSQQQPMIYVVDDEDEFLKLIAHVLENAGFQVKAFNTSDDALKGLQSEMPQLILSDINLETSTAGGFTFYERVRQFDHLLYVPFIFLSGMADEGMVRYGKGLGADDYLTKPFSSDMLLDTVKGKLKRFKAFRKN
jgi:CheY-like chemotaxis protein